jgi:hypothetical protein
VPRDHSMGGTLNLLLPDPAGSCRSTRPCSWRGVDGTITHTSTVRNRVGQTRKMSLCQALPLSPQTLVRSSLVLGQLQLPLQAPVGVPSRPRAPCCAQVFPVTFYE